MIAVRYNVPVRQHEVFDVHTGTILRIFTDRVAATHDENRAFADGWVLGWNERSEDDIR